MSIRKHTILNLAGAIIPLGVSLITIPIYLEMIGEARFGVLAIAWLLLGYFGLFDLGLGRATAQRIAALRSEEPVVRAQTFWTALCMNIGLGIVGGVLLWPLASYFFGSVFRIEDALRPEIREAVIWLVIAVPVATLSGVLIGALQGLERFLEINLISISGTILFQLLPLAAAALWGADLAILLPAAIVARLLTLIFLFEVCRRRIIQGHKLTFARSHAGHLLRFGGWVTVTSFIGPMMVILDRFIIGALSGAKAVTYYTVPFQLGERSTLLSGALTSALFPRFAAAPLEEEQRLAHEALHMLVVVMTPMVVAGIVFMKPFLSWWIEPAFAEESALVGKVILAGFWANSLAKVSYAQLQARGRPDLVAKCHISELLPYFGMLYLGLNTIGLVGAALAFSVRVLVDLVLLSGLAGILHLLMPLLLMPILLLGAAFFLSLQDFIVQLEWFSITIVFLALTVAWAWRAAPQSLVRAISACQTNLTSLTEKNKGLHK